MDEKFSRATSVLNTADFVELGPLTCPTTILVELPFIVCCTFHHKFIRISRMSKELQKLLVFKADTVYAQLGPNTQTNTRDSLFYSSLRIL